jgi:uncharacterized membrane protein (UPF0127 family)
MSPRRAGSARRPDRRTSGRRRLALLWVALVFACHAGNGAGPEPEGWVEIQGKRVWVEVADTPREQEKGLGERDSLAWDHGMYFEYDRPAFYAFWMKGMRFSIDIVWLREGRIVDLDPNVPFEEGSNGPTLRPAELVDAVLEVPAGYAAVHGWRIGDRVKMERLKEK